MENKRGKFIVIEGTDGSGKATQTELLAKYLLDKGFRVQCFDFPRYGQRSASMVEDYLNGKFGTAEQVGPFQASIFYAIDRYAASFEIEKCLQEGKVVISNRYVSANMGHQTGKIKDQKDKDAFLDWLEDLEFNKFVIPKPDFVFLLLMPVKVGQLLVDQKGNRKYVGGTKRDIHEADIQHLMDAEEAYKYCAKKYSWLVINCAFGNTIESVRTKEDIAQEIKNKAEEIIKS